MISELPTRFPLFLPAVAWVSGVALARSEQVGWLPLGMMVLALVLWIAVFRHRYFCIWMLLGILWGGGNYLYDVYRVSYDDVWLNKDIQVQAQVESVQDKGYRTHLRLTHVHRNDGVVLPGKVDVYLYGAMRIPREGQKIHATLRLHPPHNHHNPGGFDYEAYCFARHIALLGSMRPNWQIISARPDWLRSMRQQVAQSLPQDAQVKGTLEALLLGKRDSIPLSIQDAFAATGTAHLLAISGLHMAMVASLGGFLMFFLMTRREAWIVQHSVASWSMIAGVLVAMAYATLAAWPLPTQRAAMMLVAAAVAWHLRAHYQPLNILCAALILVVFWDTAAVFSVSLWLSFLATLALLSLVGEVSQRQGWRAYTSGLLKVTLVATAATLPVIVSVFGMLPVWTLLANLLLVPLYAFCILPLALLGEWAAVLQAQDVATWLMQIAAWGVKTANTILLLLYHAPAGQMWVVSPAWWLQALYILGMVGVWSVKRYRLWLLTWVMAGYGAYLILERQLGEMQWIAWDVGQGAASTLLQPLNDGRTHVWVMDVPGSKGSRFNGGTTVASGLRAMGLTHVDVLMLSHAQSDHDGGMFRLLASVNNIGELWLADVPYNHHHLDIQRMVKMIRAQGGRVRWLKRGDVLRVGKARLKVLWPPAGYDPGNTNNTSLVCSIHLVNGKSLLASGDMERQVEHQLLPALKPHTLVLMPHHGSRTSSTDDFVRAVKPDIAVAQTGFHNHFGFPKPEVVRRYQAEGASMWNTANGAVLWFPERTSKNIVYFKSEKKVKRDTALQWLQLLL